MKKEYSKPNIEIVSLEGYDVLTTSQPKVDNQQFNIHDFGNKTFSGSWESWLGGDVV